MLLPLTWTIVFRKLVLIKNAYFTLKATTVYFNAICLDEDIYKVIKEQLSEKKYEIFKNQEISWLDERDKKAEDNANKFEGMDFAQVEYNLSLAKLTKERCYKLVNEYLQ